jgi:hypothetical protein
MNVRRNGFRITERDEAIVRFVGLQVGAEARQISAWQGMDRAHVFRRCKRLVELGLLRQERVVHGRPGLYVATKAGLDFAGVGLPPAKINLWSYEHAVELVWLYIDLWREFGAGRVATERAIRSNEFGNAWAAERAWEHYRPRFALAGRGGPRSLYFPDLVVEEGAPDGRTLFVELELSVKSSERRRQLVRDYCDASQVGRVRYYAAGAAFAAMRRTIERERAQAVIELREWWPTTAIGASR